MPDTRRSMFAREVDFSIEGTDNSYAACRALSQRARDINSRLRHLPEGVEVELPSPTVGALNDYSNGRIVLKVGDGRAGDGAPTPEPGDA